MRRISFRQRVHEPSPNSIPGGFKKSYFWSKSDFKSFLGHFGPIFGQKGQNGSFWVQNGSFQVDLRHSWPFSRHSHKTTLYSRWNLYKNIYANCTHIYGNLVLRDLKPHKDFNLDFISQIEEVYGYVLIDQVELKKIPLYNLKTIRGYRLIKKEIGNDGGLSGMRHSLDWNSEDYALLFKQSVCDGYYIPRLGCIATETMSQQLHDDLEATKTPPQEGDEPGEKTEYLQLYNLQEIQRGSVEIEDMPKTVKNVNTIDWRAMYSALGG